MYDYLSIRITNLGTIQTNQELVYCNCFYFKRGLIPLSILYPICSISGTICKELKPMVNWIQSVIDSVFILFFVIIRREKYILHKRKYFKQYKHFTPHGVIYLLGYGMGIYYASTSEILCQKNT